MSMPLSVGACALLAVLASASCTKEKVDPAPPPDASARPPPPAPRPPPPAGPCASDADCSVFLDQCDCRCHPLAGTAPAVPNQAWAAMCGGGPTRNCGAASPCMNIKATCDTATKACKLVR